MALPNFFCTRIKGAYVHCRARLLLRMVCKAQLLLHLVCKAQLLLHMVCKAKQLFPDLRRGNSLELPRFAKQATNVKFQI
jgi:hypothetical protein